MTMKPFRRTPQYLNWQRIRASLFLGLTPALALTPLSVQAQDPPKLEEVLVTATRRGDTDILKTPVAVTAITANDVRTYAPRDLNDIAVMVPNLSAGTVSAFKSASFAMRGVSESTIILYKESPVGVTIDDFVVNHVQTQNLEMFDIAQIEVLRGPQGTLFGKNTTGGTINVKTKRPLLDERTIDVTGEYGDFGTTKVTTALNIPIIENVLGFRLAAMGLNSDGYYENGAAYGPTTIAPGLLAPGGGGDGVSGRGDGDDLGGDDVVSLRSKLLWQPTDNFNALFQYEYIRDNGDTPPVVNESGDVYEFTRWGFYENSGDPIDKAGVTNNDDFLLNMSDGHQVDIDGYYLNMEWAVGDYVLHSVTGYREQDSHLPSTYTGETYQTLFDATRDDKRETTQQEIRLVSDLDGPFNFVVGGFYQKEDIKFCVLHVVGFLDLLLEGEPGFLFENPLILCNEQNAKAYAAFADGTYDIGESFHLSAGIRYTDEEKEWTGRSRVPIQALPDGGFDPNFTYQELNDPLNGSKWGRFPAGVQKDDDDWQETTYRANLAYDFSDDLFGYVSYNRGFKSGGYNDQTGTLLNPIPEGALGPVDPETADSYELGLKGTLFGGAVNFAAVGFYVEYDDAQRTINASFPNGQETLFFNAAELEVKGIELEGSWAVTDSLLLRGNAMYQDAEFNEFTADTDFDGVDDVDLSGNTPTRAPEYMATLDGTYTYDFSAGSLAVNLRVAYEDESVSSYSDVGEAYDTYLDEKTVWDASVTYRTPEDRYFVRALAKNFTDERYRTGSLSVGNLWVMSAYGPPRYYGLEVGATFDF
jgi:iron complex outermembrane receptor protein